MPDLKELFKKNHEQCPQCNDNGDCELQLFNEVISDGHEVMFNECSFELCPMMFWFDIKMVKTEPKTITTGMVKLYDQVFSKGMLVAFWDDGDITPRFKRYGFFIKSYGIHLDEDNTPWQYVRQLTAEEWNAYKESQP